MHGMTLSICEYRDEDDYTCDDIYEHRDKYTWDELSVYEYRDEDEYTWDDTVCI